MSKPTNSRRGRLRLSLFGAVSLLLLTSACFQPSGAALEATQGAQVAFAPSLTPEPVTVEALPSATEFPTITPSPELPTATPSPVPTDTLYIQPNRGC